MFRETEKVVDPFLVQHQGKLGHSRWYSSNYVCFECRFSAKGSTICPHCGNLLYNVGYRARVPGKTQDNQWKKFEKLFKPKNYKPEKPSREIATEPEERKWTCQLCNVEHVVPKEPQPLDVPACIQELLCKLCWKNMQDHFCINQEKCKPSNKNKIPLNKKCPKCIPKNAPKVAKRMKALEAVKKLA